MCSVGQLCPTLWEPMDCSPPGSSVHRIFQAKIQERLAVSFSRGSSRSRDWTHIFCISWIGRWVLYHWTTWEGQCRIYSSIKWDVLTIPTFWALGGLSVKNICRRLVVLLVCFVNFLSEEIWEIKSLSLLTNSVSIFTHFCQFHSKRYKHSHFNYFPSGCAESSLRCQT